MAWLAVVSCVRRDLEDDAAASEHLSNNNPPGICLLREPVGYGVISKATPQNSTMQRSLVPPLRVVP